MQGDQLMADEVVPGSEVLGDGAGPLAGLDDLAGAPLAFGDCAGEEAGLVDFELGGVCQY